MCDGQTICFEAHKVEPKLIFPFKSLHNHIPGVHLQGSLRVNFSINSSRLETTIRPCRCKEMQDLLDVLGWNCLC